MKPQMNEPNWPTTILPAGLAIIGNSSCCSRMPGDIAVRKSTVSISKRALRKALSMMSMVTVSTLTFFIFLELRWRIRAGMTELRLEGVPACRSAAARGRRALRPRACRGAGIGPDENVAEAVDAAMVARQDDRGRVHLEHDRRAGDAVAGPQP